MDGFEACRRIKADARTADIPVIFVTAIDRVAEETRGLELGAIDFISKPFSPQMAGLFQRPGDLVARYGGEEFVGVLAETDPAGASRVADSPRWCR
jgi:PleD family two-component response regulator